jgi:hypothetical protein
MTTLDALFGDTLDCNEEDLTHSCFVSIKNRKENASRKKKIKLQFEKL